jgi:hypothetical protein
LRRAWFIGAVDAVYKVMNNLLTYFIFVVADSNLLNYIKAESIYIGEKR